MPPPALTLRPDMFDLEGGAPLLDDPSEADIQRIVKDFMDGGPTRRAELVLHYAFHWPTGWLEVRKTLQDLHSALKIKESRALRKKELFKKVFKILRRTRCDPAWLSQVKRWLLRDRAALYRELSRIRRKLKKLRSSFPEEAPVASVNVERLALPAVGQ